VLLVCVENFEPTEAARIIGVSPEAFRQRLSRGREQLRAALEEKK
jgi:DNA-directed RNA polymerase specialized sigma24 family protein